MVPLPRDKERFSQIWLSQQPVLSTAPYKFLSPTIPAKQQAAIISLANWKLGVLKTEGRDVNKSNELMIQMSVLPERAFLTINIKFPLQLCTHTMLFILLFCFLLGCYTVNKLSCPCNYLFIYSVILTSYICPIKMENVISMCKKTAYFVYCCISSS